MSLIKEYKEEIEAVILVLLVGGNLIGYVPVEVIVPIAGLISAEATNSLKKKLKKAGEIGNKL